MLPNVVMVVYIWLLPVRTVAENIISIIIHVACSGELTDSSIPVSKLSLCVCIITFLTLAVISGWLSLSPLSPDPTRTVASVTAVLESVGDWYGLGHWLGVPEPVQDVIRGSHRDDSKTALAEYFVNSVPVASWTTLASALYYKEESAALLAVGRHLKEEKGWWGNVIC